MATTLSIFLLIAIGVVLQAKLGTTEHAAVFKCLVLNVALPATIFSALLEIDVDYGFIYLPVLAILFNLSLLVAVYFAFSKFGIGKGNATNRTLMMMTPSLAPGLSLFPFLAAYVGEEGLAQAALADTGNKVFVLYILYFLAMRWHFQFSGYSRNFSAGFERLVLSFVREPITVAIVVALAMLGLGLQMESLPVFLQDSVAWLSALTVPLILLFIGVMVKFERGDTRLLFSVLTFRSGFGFLLSALLLMVVPNTAPSLALLAVLFPQSACSFWPYAHIAAVDAMERESGNAGAKTSILNWRSRYWPSPFRSQRFLFFRFAPWAMPLAIRRYSC